MTEEQEPEEMEKRGVACDCANHPEDDPKEMVKTAEGGMACPHCGKPSKKKDLTEQSK